MVALKALPPTIMCRWEDGRAPGWAAGSRRWAVKVEHGKRRPAWEEAMKAAKSPRVGTVFDFILAAGRTWKAVV